MVVIRKVISSGIDLYQRCRRCYLFGVDLDDLLERVQDTPSPFGETPGQGTPLKWLGPMSQSRVWLQEWWPRLRAHVIADGLRLQSSGWCEGDQIVAPATFHPGDGPALRAAVLGLGPQAPDLFDRAVDPNGDLPDDWFTYRVLAATLARAERLVTAELAYLPASTAVSLLSGFRPDRELYNNARLPHQRMLVILGAPLRFSAESEWWDAEHISALDQVDLMLARNNNLPVSVATAKLPSNFYRHGGAIAAIWLEADSDGRLVDEVGFLGFENINDRLTLPRLTVGSLERATLAPMIENLVCALCWGHWSVPGRRPDLPDPTTREYRRLIGTSSFKRQSKSGLIDQVRLLDLQTATVRSPRSESSSPTRTVAAHLRRGHFRRVRVVTRDAVGNVIGSRAGSRGVDWDYQGRWIPPTVVNPKGPDMDTRDRVYLLPEPPTPEEWEAYRLAHADGVQQSEAM